MARAEQAEKAPTWEELRGLRSAELKQYAGYYGSTSAQYQVDIQADGTLTMSYLNYPTSIPAQTFTYCSDGSFRDATGTALMALVQEDNGQVYLYQKTCAQLPGLGLTLKVGGADLMDGTPIFDIKPYVPYADCKREARGGFAPDAGERLKVVWAPGTADKLPENKLAALAAVLARDPRPQYQHDPERLYAMDFAGYTLRFTVEGEELTVREAEPALPGGESPGKDTE